MNKETILVGALMLLLGGIGGYTIAQQHIDTYKSEQPRETLPLGMHQMPDGSMMGNPDTRTNGMNNMDHMMTMMVQSERTFITGMIPHHQEAVDTAKAVIARGGTTPEIRQLAENIIVAQEKEIADMKAWYEVWYKESYKDDGTYVPMMRDLSTLSGAELDKTFLEDMIMHHMGAIMMARSVQPYIEHQELETLTEAVVTTQSVEISHMRQMLLTL
jgi:uncharacterized protein (DUF305 family)